MFALSKNKQFIYQTENPMFKKNSISAKLNSAKNILFIYD